MPAPVEPVPVEEARPPARIGAVTGALLIVGNMIGVGVFTSAGYMAGAIPSSPAILLVWLLGGIAAFCGALTYAEMGSAIARNGGEYRLLSRAFHPAVGFVAAWVSLIVGFSGPLAAFAGYFGTYLQAVFPSVAPVPAGLCVIAVCATAHALDVGWGSGFHNVFTIGKISLIMLFIVAGLAHGDLSRWSDSSTLSTSEAIASPLFAVQLVYASFAYAGWNTAAYVAGEFRHPERDILRSVLVGTAIVTVLYLGLNAVFLASAPLADLAAEPDTVANTAAVHLFGPTGGRLVSALIAVGLVSTVSANLMAGPRVYEAVGSNFPALRFLSRRQKGGGPFVAIALQATIATVMLLSSQLKELLSYMGVTLAISAGATVLGVFALRRREPDLPRPYRTWGYPVTPLVFLALEGWMIFFAVKEKPLAAVFSAATIATGLLIYAIVRNRKV